MFGDYKCCVRNSKEEKYKKLLVQIFILNFGRIYDYEKQRKNRNKQRKKIKKSEKVKLLIFLGNYWLGSDLVKDFDDLCYFLGCHTNRGKSNFCFKVSGFFSKSYTYCILPMLNMIVMKVAKLYVLYETYQWITIYAWHDIIGILTFVHGDVALIVQP